VKGAVGDGSAVADGLGDTIGSVATDRVEILKDTGVFVVSGTGAGCEVQALKRKKDRARESKRDFMQTIIAEAARRVKRLPLS
jgi:hypothetical protein